MPSGSFWFCASAGLAVINRNKRTAFFMIYLLAGIPSRGRAAKASPFYTRRRFRRGSFRIGFTAAPHAASYRGGKGAGGGSKLPETMNTNGRSGNLIIH